MENPTGAPSGAETPAAPVPTSESADLASYRRAKSETPAPAAAQPADETPDPEVEADPELASEIDKIEPPKRDETPAEKAARTKRHKEAARKGYLTRLANKATRLERELEEARRQPPAGRGEQPPARAHQPAPHQAETATDPNDPEPQWDTTANVNAFAAKHPDHPDPYAGALAEFNKSWNRWDRRQADRAAAAERARLASADRARQAGERLTKHAEHGRSQHRDYDAVLGQLADAVKGHPVDEVIAEALAEIEDQKVGGEVVYRLGKDLAALQACRSRGELLRLIGRIERDITAAAEQPAAPHVSAAPAPHAPVPAAGTASARFDVTKASGSIEDYRRSKAAAGAR